MQDVSSRHCQPNSLSEFPYHALLPALYAQEDRQTLLRLRSRGHCDNDAYQ